MVSSLSVSFFYIFIDFQFPISFYRIIILKGRAPMFLQTFHHAGIVLMCWSFIATQNTPAGALLVLLNSFIHTLMYTYYVFAAFGFNSSLKKYLTQAQLAQFLLGGILLLRTQFMDGCINQAQRRTNEGMEVYLVVLIGLFYSFYVASYTKKPKTK